MSIQRCNAWLRSVFHVCVAVAILAGASGVRAQIFPGDTQAPIVLFRSDKRLSKFVENYYRQPNPAAAFNRLLSLDLRRLHNAGRKSGDPHYLEVLGAFYAHIARANPRATAAYVGRAIAQGGRLRLIYAHQVVYLAAAPNSAALIRRLRSVNPSLAASMTRLVRNLRAFPYPNLPILHARHLDILWASFFASGESRYIRRIASALVAWRPISQAKAEARRLLPAVRRGDRNARLQLMRLIVAYPAYVFLRNNARVHPRVRAILRQIARSRARPEAAVVRKILGEL